MVRGDDKGQIHTLEGLCAAILMITAAFFVTQAVTVTSPQTSSYMDAHLIGIGEDALTLLDQRETWQNETRLQKYVIGWNDTEESLSDLNSNLYKLLPKSVRYNVDFAYPGNDSTQGLTVHRVITHGEPLENAVTVTRLVTIYDSDYITAINNPILEVEPGDAFKIRTVVEVRLILWFA